MRAGVFIGDGQVGVADVDEPAPPGPGEVQLDVAFCGVCGSDLHMAEHEIFAAGQIIGHEFSGTVRAVGDGVANLDVGLRAAIRPYLACGHCRECGDGKNHLCRELEGIGFGRYPGGLAPRINVPAAVLYRLPDGLAMEHGAVVEPLAVALHAVRDSGLGAGDSAVIMGAGPIGIATTIAARLAGAKQIIVTEMSEGRAARAAEFGADHVLLEGKDDVFGEVQRLTDGGPDVVFECVGVAGTIGEAVQHVKRAGRVQVVGVCFEPDPIIPALWLTKEPVLQICFCYTPAEFAETVEYVGAGRVPADEMISRVESVDKIADVFQDLRTTKTDIKVLLKPIA